MERDFFKQYVEEHRDAFESDALPPNMLGNILENLKKRDDLKAKKKRKLTYTWLAAACSLILVTGAYLFFTNKSTPMINPQSEMASITSNTVKQPVVSKGENIIEVKNTARILPQKMLAYLKPTDLHQTIYKALIDSSSVANRMNAIIRLGSLVALDDKLKTELCRTFSNDGNDNVRLAALGVLAKYSDDSYINRQLIESLNKQKDPVVQLELIKILGTNSNPETTDKLIEMASNPFTIDAVKEQVYYALLSTNN